MGAWRSKGGWILEMKDEKMKEAGRGLKINGFIYPDKYSNIEASTAFLICLARTFPT